MQVRRLHICYTVSVLLVVGAIGNAAAAPRKSLPPRLSAGATRAKQPVARNPRSADVRLLGNVISKQALAKAKGVPSRRAVVGALLASGLTRGKLEALAQTEDLPATQLQTRSLSGARLGTPLVFRAPALGVTIPPSDLPTYDQIDWDSGVYFTPLSHGGWFTEGAHTYRLGVLGCFGVHAGFSSGLGDMYQENILLLNRSRHGVEVHLIVDLPLGQATYAATVKLMGADGSTFAQVVGDRELSDVCGVTVGTGLSQSRPDPALLSDGDGVVMMFSREIRSRGYGAAALQRLKMRDVTCFLSWYFTQDYAYEHDLVLSGIKIERL